MFKRILRFFGLMTVKEHLAGVMIRSINHAIRKKELSDLIEDLTGKLRESRASQEEAERRFLSAQTFVASVVREKYEAVRVSPESGRVYRYYEYEGGPLFKTHTHEVRAVEFGVRYLLGLDQYTPPEYVAREIAEKLFVAILKQWRDQSVLLSPYGAK